MFIFPRVRMTNTLEKNGPPHAKYRCSKSGWSNEQLFYEWLEHFRETVKPSKDQRVLIILDNHSSHISLKIYEFCKHNGIELLTIPPHTSHRIQPLDLTFYGPLKAAFNRQCDNYLLHFDRITPNDLAELFHKAYRQVATMEKAQSGFAISGIWPFNPEKFTKEDFLPASHHIPAVTINDEGADIEAPGPSSSKNKQQIQLKENTSNTLPEISKASGSDCLQAEVSFEELDPIPTPASTKTIQRRKKQKSEILTETPNKENVLASELRKKARQVALENKLKGKPTKKGKSNARLPCKNKKVVKRKVFQDSDSEEEVLSDSQLCNDDELDDLQTDTQDRCLICDDTSKKEEYWFQCSVCNGWAHELCSGVDSPEGYVCDICDR